MIDCLNINPKLFITLLRTGGLVRSETDGVKEAVEAGGWSFFHKIREALQCFPFDAPFEPHDHLY